MAPASRETNREELALDEGNEYRGDMRPSDFHILLTPIGLNRVEGMPEFPV